jgi:hypothetical protein
VFIGTEGRVTIMLGTGTGNTRNEMKIALKGDAIINTCPKQQSLYSAGCSTSNMYSLAECITNEIQFNIKTTIQRSINIPLCR